MKRILSNIIILLVTGIVFLFLGIFWANQMLGYLFGIAGILIILWSINLKLFQNLRTHLDYIEKQLLSLHSAIALTRIQLPNPYFSSRHAVSPDFLELISEIIRRKHVKKILELGSGTSTIYIAAFLSLFIEDGELWSLEESQTWADMIQTELDQAIEKFKRRIKAKVLFAPLIQNRVTESSFYDLAVCDFQEKGPFDLIIVDGPGDVRMRPVCWELLKNYSNQNTIWLWDDGDKETVQAAIQKWQKEFADLKSKYYPTVKGSWILWKDSNEAMIPFP